MPYFRWGNSNRERYYVELGGRNTKGEDAGEAAGEDAGEAASEDAGVCAGEDAGKRMGGGMQN